MKRFRVTLEKHEHSEAAMMTVPFDVQKVFGTRARNSATRTKKSTPRPSPRPKGPKPAPAA